MSQEDTLAAMTITELKEELSARNLDVSGLKGALIERLANALAGETGGAAPDAFKLFVGQIPPTMTEDELREVLSPFGGITNMCILKDRMTQQPKGCGFVTYTTKAEADAAIEGLAEKVTLPGAKRTMIMNYAQNGQGRPANNSGVSNQSSGTEVKLYVGMLSRQSTEAEIKAIFDPYGTVNEVYLMRNRDNPTESKGSAFVRYSTTQEAQAAIDALNEQYRDKESPGLLQVRFAQPKKTEQQNNMGNFGMGMGGMNNMNMMNMMNMMGGMGGMQGMQGMGGMGGMPQGYGGVSDQQWGQGAAQPADPSNPYSQGQAGAGVAQQAGGAGQDFSAYGYGGQFGQFGMGGMGMAGMGAMAGMGNMAGMGGMGSYGGNANQSVRVNDQQKGPPGSNIFVYGIPENYTDMDLASLFQNFGNILSTKVQMDLQTGHSKGFGFVSFDNPQTAQTAISTMNGFVLGSKRLDVKLKTDGGGGGGGGRRFTPY